MARTVNFSFLRGGGSTVEILYGKLTLTPTLLHSVGTSAVIPAPTGFDLVNGKATALNVAPTPAPVAGQIEWAYKVTVEDRHGKKFEWLVGVPDATTPIDFIALPRYYETKPPLFGKGEQGVPGSAATIAIGTTTSGPTPAVTNSGTSTEAVLNFTLAKGDKGDTGAGVPTGGTALQVVRKNAANTTTEWADVTKALVGLGNVDNTSDANKPVSTAQALAIERSDTLDYRAKNSDEAPLTYPEGVTVFLGEVNAGWPQIAGSSATFTVIRTDRTRTYGSAIQYASGYNADSVQHNESPVMYRLGNNGGVWGEWQVIATQAALAASVSQATTVANRSITPYLSGSDVRASVEASGDIYPPRVVNEHILAEDPDGRLVDGAKFFAPINVGSLAGTWLDKWYGYLAGHDSPTVWLMTAPSLIGPWTYVEAVIGIPGSGAVTIDARYQVHTSSPEVMYRDGKIHLYYHGPLKSNMLEQPTTVATSTNGRNFTLGAMVLDTEYANNGSPYKTSTSYMKLFRHAGLYHAIWQGTTGRDSVVDGNNYAPIPCGYATSTDGLNWVKRPPVVLGGYGGTGSQGLFAPGLVRTQMGWIVAGTFRTWNGSAQISTTKIFFGESMESLRPLGDIVLPGVGRQQSINSPSFHTENGKFYMICGSRRIGSTKPNIMAFELEW